MLSRGADCVLETSGVAQEGAGWEAVQLGQRLWALHREGKVGPPGSELARLSPALE